MASALIRYQPLRDEIDYTGGFSNEDLNSSLVLPNSKEADPFSWAATCIRQWKKDVPWIVVPGKLFDLYGTRHGRGFGWYDRFLAAIPTDWPRIGITTTSQLSTLRLPRQAWDQPVDWLMIYDGSVVGSVFETRARWTEIPGQKCHQLVLETNSQVALVSHQP